MTESLLERSARYIDGASYEGPRTINPIDGSFHEVADGVALVCGFSHIWTLDGGDSLALLDTSLPGFAAAAVQHLRRWRDVPVDTIVYTHGHVDHVSGARTFVERGETDDHTIVWVPQIRALFTGDLIIWAFPNAGNPQKAQRYAADWAAALRRMIDLRPELLLPAHGLPIAGAERIAAVLDDTAAALEGLVRDTLEMMNAGARLDEIVNTVRVPQELLDKPYLRPSYDEPEFAVRNIWRLYGGWHDGNPARLKPPPDRAVAAEVAVLAGGADRLARRAAELCEAGELRLACQLAEWAGQAAPDDADVHAARAEVYRIRRERELSLMARNLFRDASRASEAVSQPSPRPD